MQIRLLVHKSWWGGDLVLLGGNKKFLKIHIPENIELYFLNSFTKCKPLFRILIKITFCPFFRKKILKQTIYSQIQLRCVIFFGLIWWYMFLIWSWAPSSMLIIWWTVLPLIEYERTEHAVRMLKYTDSYEQCTNYRYIRRQGKRKEPSFKQQIHSQLQSLNDKFITSIQR